MGLERDHQFMRHALTLARRGLGRTGSNPSVGCVLVKNDIVLAAAHTGEGGRPHAENLAVAMAGDRAQGATAYVTLEPCSHHGQTPPCAAALIGAGLARVVVGCIDPDPRVSGSGIALLKEAGLDVTAGVMEQEARDLHQGFILHRMAGRPMVSLKIATTPDGQIAEGNGRPVWITGDLARRHAHRQRSMHDAILTGIGTILHDNPLLTPRIKSFQHNILKAVLDPDLKCPADAAVLQSAKDHPAVIFYKDAPANRVSALQDRGAQVIRQDTYDLPAVLGRLSGFGVTRLLVEGGPRVFKSFLSAGLYDRILWYKAGSSPAGLVQGLASDDLNLIASQNHLKTVLMGQDRLEIYNRKQ